MTDAWAMPSTPCEKSASQCTWAVHPTESVYDSVFKLCQPIFQMKHRAHKLREGVWIEAQNALSVRALLNTVSYCQRRPALKAAAAP